MGGFLKRVGDILQEAVYPSNIYCICCGSLIDKTRPYSLCDECVRKFHWINEKSCSKCGKALEADSRENLCYDCRIYEHHFYKGFSCLTYGLLERKVLMDYKYNGKGYLCEKLGDILYDRISCENISPDVIIPVPIGADRMKSRGYNQAALMARRLAMLWGRRCEEEALVRKRQTGLLRSLNPTERRLVLDGAFAINDATKVNNKTVLLIDDIYTTGATVDACSKVLMDAGARRVYVLTLASGGNRKPEDE